MFKFVEDNAAQVKGMYSCYDRIRIKGTLLKISHTQGMESYLYEKNIKIYDYPRYANELRETYRTHVIQLAAKEGVEIEHITSYKTSKEARIQEIIKKRGKHPGLVHIISAMEGCRVYTPSYDKEKKRPYLKARQGKCLHYYFYFIDQPKHKT